MDLNNEEKKILLELARNSIASLFQKTESSPIDYDKYPILNSTSGVFVTLTIKGKLRGCIGYIISDRPLIETLQDAAVQAATGDPRFPILSHDEFSRIEIEISILSKPFPIGSYDDIVLGKHGLIIEEQGRRGLLLPQVPIEHHLNRDEYLSALCQKAGLYPDLWKDKKINLEAFTATVFSEKELEV